MKVLYTIGHSTHPVERFAELLEACGVTAVGDVRSSPYSRFNPQYNREPLQRALKGRGMAYVFLGRELGPRSDDPACYVDGKVRYDRLARTELFAQGLRRLRKGMESHRIALLCAEKDPIVCHRMILVCRALRKDPVSVEHILEDGSLESLARSEQRLLQSLKMPQLTLFDDPETLVQRAYDVQGEKIAYVRRDDNEEGEEV